MIYEYFEDGYYQQNGVYLITTTTEEYDQDGELIF